MRGWPGSLEGRSIPQSFRGVEFAIPNPCSTRPTFSSVQGLVGRGFCSTGPRTASIPGRVGPGLDARVLPILSEYDLGQVSLIIKAEMSPRFGVHRDSGSFVARLRQGWVGKGSPTRLGNGLG